MIDAPAGSPFVDRLADELVRVAVRRRRMRQLRARVASVAAVVAVLAGVVVATQLRSSTPVEAVAVNRPAPGIVEVEYDTDEPADAVVAALRDAGLTVVVDERSVGQADVGKVVGMLTPGSVSATQVGERRFRIRVPEGETFVVAVGVYRPGSPTDRPIDVTAPGEAYHCVLWVGQDARALADLLGGSPRDAYDIYDADADRSISPSDIAPGRIIRLAQTFNSPVLHIWIGAGDAQPAPAGCR